MHASMPPETPPPDDARRPAPSGGEGNVVDPEVLAERRALRAEQAEQSAARRAADAQVLAAQLARERARLEAERDAARAEAAAAREGADAAIAEARHLADERDTLRAALASARTERDALRRVREEAPAAHTGPIGDAAHAASSGGAALPGHTADSASPDDRMPAAPAASAPTPAPAPSGVPARAEDGVNGSGVVPRRWADGLRRELTVARAATAVVERAAPAALSRPAVGLARERQLVARRAAAPLGIVSGGPLQAPQRRGNRAAPVTALALERERSSRLQAQLDSSLAVQRELRTHIAALQRAVHQRVEAERRIEAALRRVREELTTASRFVVERAPQAQQPTAAVPPSHRPATAAPAGPPRAAAGTAGPSAMPAPPAFAPAPQDTLGPTPAVAPSVDTAPPQGPSAPSLSAPASGVHGGSAAADAAPAPLTGSPPPTAGASLDPQRLAEARERLRAAVPAAGGADEPPAPLPFGPSTPWLTVALQRLLASEPEIAGGIAVGLLPAYGLAAGCALRYDLLLEGRGCLAVDVEPGRATVALRPAPRPRGERDLSIAADAVGFAKLLHGRRTLRRPARVRGGRRALRELRRIARTPLGLRDVAAAGAALDPALALRLVALAIEPAATRGERFAIAHAPLGGGPVDAWLRIADGAEPQVCDRAPAEPVRLTLRCTRGAILPLIAGVDAPPGETGRLDGDDRPLALLRRWIAQTERSDS
jgi:hypothetical protein